MIGPNTRGNWVGLVCDASSVVVLAVRGCGRAATLVAQQSIDFDHAELQEHGRIRALEQLIADRQLAGCDAQIIFAGSGTIVQKLTLPPLSARNRLRAARTHLTNYADGHELAVDVSLDTRSPRGKGVHLLAAGVDLDLARGVARACRRAGLRARCTTALASAFGPTADRGALVQLVLGENTTTVQLFDEGRLIACRDVLLGRRDFLVAYQRPILTEDGSITLSPEEADVLSRTIGIPMGREEKIRPDISATQLWPTLNPVLQKLLHEVEQSLAHSQWSPQEACLSVLGLPVLPGLDEFLAAEMRLQGPLTFPRGVEAEYLAALSGHYASGRPPDLRPPEERFGDGLTKPALAAGLCALLIIMGNWATPRTAEAQATRLRPLAERLQQQLAYVQQERTAVEATGEALAAELRRDASLRQFLPVPVPTIGPLKVVYGSVPPDVELLEVSLHGTEPASLDISAGCRGDVAASIVAAGWAKELSDSVFFSSVKVNSVSGSGRDGPAIVELRATLQGPKGD